MTTIETKEEDFGGWIETYTGKQFHILAPQPEEIDIYDIAHALSMQCRYTGHCEAFYSVAEHSYIVSLLVPKEHALAALFHDASEAYLTDVASPVKPHLTNYKELEDTIMTAIAKKVGFIYPLSYEVKQADRAMLKTEAKYLMPSGGSTWNQEQFGDGSVKGKIPKCLQPIEAKQLFLTRFWELSETPVVEHGVSPIWTPNN
jgi:hypothetical protein